MPAKIQDFACAKCGSNRFMFPKAAADTVRCGDCGAAYSSLAELEAKVAGGGKPKETRTQRHARHDKEVSDSNEKLRASIAETDRLLKDASAMTKRHRREDDDAGD